jgi:hypothetical protein
MPAVRVYGGNVNSGVTSKRGAAKFPEEAPCLMCDQLRVSPTPSARGEYV